MMNDSIEKKTLKSVAWTSVDRFGALAIQFIVTSILARLLEPADFGMVGGEGVWDLGVLPSYKKKMFPIKIILLSS